MAEKINGSRRKLILGGLAAGAVATAALLRPGDRGKNHSSYFKSISDALHDAGLARPTLVIDKQLLLNNVAKLKSNINQRFDYRIVGKSLPSLPLLETVMAASDSNRLMMFHEPFLSQAAIKFIDSDILMGKPMPVVAAANFYKTMAKHISSANHFDATKQMQWLIDTPERLKQYSALAQQLNIKMNINIELDVGLHRGGIQTPEALVSLLSMIQQNKNLRFSGVMGYEPHVAKVPGNKIAHRDAAMAIYRQHLAAAQKYMGSDLSDLTLNAAGSPTYRYYAKGEFPLNELAAGSCLVKPVDFDLPILAEHQPASFIATPVLKTKELTELPGVDGLGKLMAMWDKNRQRTFFSYGGYWKSQPVSPEGLSVNPVFGRSTNQEMYNGSSSVDLKPDDWLFLRPTQSEFVFLQFGDIAVYDQGKITDMWPVFNASA